ncbi:long-chain-fatty-acid--CoA ligase [Peribacillus frigoritolerans]|uniref:long-chain-fatty-acid--CoA ligase n=1 Tax=Peribacillus frigoritolerans TaxID=450367 RepID=UPI002EB24B53|nr:long-chain-fatty-acid--CoA ligase [Peribacillus frigoritolerans]
MIITKSLMRSAKINPNKTAILEKGHRYSYGEFAERTVKLKKVLEGMGVKKQDRVGLLMFNNFRYIEIFYACTALGAIFVPLNYRLAEEELVYIINDCELKVLFLHQEFIELVPFLREKTPSITQFVVAEDSYIVSDLVSYEELLTLENGTATELECDAVHEDDIAGLFYTGGTTGKSKGVMLTHRNLVANAYQTSMIVSNETDTVYLHSAPMFHLADAGSMLNITMVNATHVILRSFTPKDFIETVKNYQVTKCLLIPTMINMILHHPSFNSHDIRSLESISYGASPMPLELLKKIMKLLPDIELYQGYGMTEASPGLTYLTAENHVLNGSEKSEKRLLSAGQPILGVDIRVIDEQGNQVAIGEVGEIIAKGPNIMKGYWNLPEETAAVIKDGWYHTGDMAMIDGDYFVYIVDRKKDMIITGGENVYSPEVENVLYKHPDVYEAAVIGVPDEKWGEAVVAIIVTKEGSKLSEYEIIQHTKRHLANYKVPKSIVFMEELPRNTAGKVLKRDLRKKYWEGSNRMVH